MLMQFLRDRRAAVLPTFAIAAIPLIVATGAVIDYSRAYRQRTIIQDSLDSAALAAGKKIGVVSNSLVQTEAANFYNTNVGTKVDIKPALTSVVTSSNVTLTTQLHVPTYFLGLIGLNEFVFNMKAVSTQGNGTLEVALVLDNSGSMAGTKIATLITSATDLTTKLYALAATSSVPNPIEMALVPFASSVNVDPANKAAAWMDSTGVAPYNGESFEGSSGSPPVSNNTPSGINVLNMFNNLTGTGSAWAGCVEERQAPYDVQDDPASVATPATMFVPMFAPDEPDNWTCTTGTCNFAGTTTATRRYNGAPSGSGKTNNNYLPDAGPASTAATACGAAVLNTVTMTSAAPAVFTKTGHGLTAGTDIVFNTTGSLYTGITAGTPYKVLGSGLTANTFEEAPSPGPAVTVTLAAPGVFTSNGHGLSAGTVVEFQTTGTLPTGLTVGTPYYVISQGLTANNFEVSQTLRTPVTMTIASPAVITSTAHGLTGGTAVVFQTTGSLPTGLTAGTTYYVVAAGLTANTFMVSLASHAVTMTIANPGVFTSTAHGLVAGSPVIFQTTGALPTGVTAATTYYVVAAGLSANSFKVSATSGSTTVTMTKATPAVFTTVAAHGLVAGNAIAFSTTGALYTGLTAGTTYYVIAGGLTATKFEVSTSVGGAAVATSGSQSGTQSYVKLVTTTGSQSGSHSFVSPIATSGSQSGTHSIVQPVATSGSQTGTHTFLKPVSTSGSQSGTQSYFLSSRTADWTCESGSADCNGSGDGRSEQTALLGQNLGVGAQNLCKYGTVANPAAVSQITVNTGSGGTYPGGPNFNCTTSKVIPLTTTKATITTAIAAMVANGTTNITAGLMWGWRVLSNSAPFTEGRPYLAANNTKYLILMTDGENTYFANSKFTVSHYGAWGYIWKSHLGTTSSTESVMTGKMEERMALACANIKKGGDPNNTADDIQVFTIAFEVTDPTTLNLLSACATDPATMAFQSSNTTELTAAFGAIGDQITKLRLSQ